jgi:3-dehydroquinate synthase
MNSTVTVCGPGMVPYEVVIGTGLLDGLGVQVADLVVGRCVIVSDETVAALYADGALQSLARQGLSADLISVPAGERSKSFAQLERVLDTMVALGLDRSSLVIALGGGVVGDLAGLAAALFMRGINLVQVPTTLLAQVDSSVGGKTAIDTPRGKNLVGAFHQPRRVVADVSLLSSLPPRQLRSGWAEVLKHGLICDPDYFTWLSGAGQRALAGDTDAMIQAVARSVEIKAAIVGADEREAGQRALLNLGHTFGHALEAELNFDEHRLTHGEAVALGTILAFRYSVHLGICETCDADQVALAFEAAGLPHSLVPFNFDPDRLMGWMATDKKTEAGQLTLILAEGVGRAIVRKAVDGRDVRDFLAGQVAQ